MGGILLTLLAWNPLLFACLLLWPISKWHPFQCLLSLLLKKRYLVVRSLGAWISEQIMLQELKWSLKETKASYRIFQALCWVIFLLCQRWCKHVNLLKNWVATSISVPRHTSALARAHHDISFEGIDMHAFHSSDMQKQPTNTHMQTFSSSHTLNWNTIFVCWPEFREFELTRSCNFHCSSSMQLDCVDKGKFCAISFSRVLCMLICQSQPLSNEWD